MNRNPSDEELVAGFINGRGEMLEELVQRYERSLYCFIVRMTGSENDAADLFQDTFIRVFAKASTFKGKGSFQSWLYAIAANLCRTHRARRWREPAADAAVLDEERPVRNGSPLPGEVVSQKEIGRRIATAVAELPEDQREVFVMKAYQQMSYPEIAETLGRPVGTVKSQMHYALEKLRGSLRGLAKAYGVG